MSTEPGPQSVKGPRINKGLVIVNTGNGKGKTTAAFAGVGQGVMTDHFKLSSTAAVVEELIFPPLMMKWI